MAKQKSFLKFTGTVGDVTFVKHRGKYFIKQKSEIDAETIKTASNFARTRENMSEFGNVTKSATLLRKTFREMGNAVKDGTAHSRLVSLLTQIKNMDGSSLRGERTVGMGIGTTGALQLLRGFMFNAASPLGQVLTTAYEVDTSTGIIQIRDLNPSVHLIAPAGATHVLIRSCVARIDFDNLISEDELSNEVVLPIDHTVSTVVLTPAALPSGAGNHIFTLKVEFGQQLNGNYFPLLNTQYNSMAIVEAV